MKKWFFVLMVMCSFHVNAQSKLIGDYTLEMTGEISDAQGNLVASSAKQIFVSGKKVRVDYNSPQFQQSLFTDQSANSAVILRETGGNKYMRVLSTPDWKKENLRFENIRFEITSETKKIAGYDCKKAIAVLKDGSKLTAYYTPTVNVIVTENDFQFKSLPGLVLEYRLDSKENSIHFTASSVSFDPVPASKFNIPANGYRII